MSGFPVGDDRAAPSILVVDDNEAARYAKSRVLRQGGYQVLEASSGTEALRFVQEQSPDLVLLDVRLPDISGLDVCRAIKVNRETMLIPVLQMSASFRDDRAKIAGLEGGADGYITEPIEPNLLLATIAAFLRTRAAEQAVRDLGLQWEATFEAISDGIALVDADGKILRANSALPSLLERPPDELAGALLDDLLPRAAAEHSLWSDLTPGVRQQTERTLSSRTFTLTLDPVVDSRGNRGGVCIVRDVTERKRMDQRLSQTQKLESVGLLAGGVAHDFNNLLMGILGNSSLALDNLDDPALLERALLDISRASERAADLTRQLLAYAGKGRFVTEHVDLSRVVREILPLVEGSFLTKVELVLELPGNLPTTRADRTQLSQIVMNMLINAAEAIGEKGGIVKLTTGARHFSADQRPRYLAEAEVRGDYVTLEVTDNGIGMDPATLRRIFDPFFTTKFLGRGLGLSAVLGIIRGHKGAIRVESSPGCGTTFELLFPSSPESVDERARSISAARDDSGVKRGRILVADDEEVVREFFRSALRLHGYDVVTAVNGAEALHIFEEASGQFDLVLLDLVMPVLGGKEVLPLLLAARPDALVIVTSGQVEEEARSELADWNIAGYVQKPCTAGTLLEKVRESLDPKPIRPSAAR